MHLLLTGVSGFVGKCLLDELSKRRHSGIILTRNIIDAPENFVLKLNSDINSATVYNDCFNSIQCVIHCAARVHIMDDQSSDPLEDFRSVNTRGTLNLAKQAAAAGIKRFIFISSIKVNGESTKGKPYTPEDSPKPEDPYGVSKFEAEQQLLKLAEETNMEVVIIRPPLVYGPGVKANFLSLMKLVSKSFPIPLGTVTKNKRSLVSLDNLIDLIQVCIEHPNAKNEIFLISDGKDMSTVELIHEIARAMKKKPLLMPIPKFVFQAVGILLRKKSITQRIFGSLQVDFSKNQKLLNWTPPFTTQQSMVKTVNYYLSQTKN